MFPVGFDPHCVVPFRWIADAGSNGVVAQLGERCVRNAEVGGSTPLDSISFFGPAIRKDCDDAMAAPTSGCTHSADYP